MFLLTKPKTRFLILELISDKNLETLWKILILFVSPFLLQCCCSHVALQSHVNIAEGNGHTYIGVSRIFGEDCRFVIFCSKDSQVQKSWTCLCQKACEVPFRLLISKIYCQIYQKEHTLNLSHIKVLTSIPFLNIKIARP